MRFLCMLAFLLFVVSCNKNKPVVRKLEGKWHLYQLLLNNGQYVEQDEIYEFTKGATDGTTYADWSRYTATDTIHGTYVVNEKGQKLILRVEEPVFSSDTANMEEMDKKLLIFRTKAGVLYFNKIN